MKSWYLNQDNIHLNILIKAGVAAYYMKLRYGCFDNKPKQNKNNIK